MNVNNSRIPGRSAFPRGPLNYSTDTSEAAKNVSGYFASSDSAAKPRALHFSFMFFNRVFLVHFFLRLVGWRGVHEVKNADQN